MKYIYYILLAFPLTVFSQDAEIYSEQVGNSIHCLVDNNEPIPVTVVVDFDLNNMVTEFGGVEKTVVIPANTEKFLVSRVLPGKKRATMSFEYETAVYLGDVTNDEFDEGYIYELPFESGSAFSVIQGYHGEFSHYNVKAIDFNLEIGDKIVASRGGVVIDVVDKHRRNCVEENCKKFNNLVRIYHNDGTEAEYVHLKQHSVKVKKGDIVEKGQFIALSGNTGWSTGPHLHFAVFKTNVDNRYSIPTLFDTKNKGVLSSLKELNI